MYDIWLIKMMQEGIILAFPVLFTWIRSGLVQAQNVIVADHHF